MIPKWEVFRDSRSYHDDDVNLFIDVNRFGRMFIKAIRRRDSGYRTFNFTSQGYLRAVEFVSGGGRHETEITEAAPL